MEEVDHWKLYFVASSFLSFSVSCLPWDQLLCLVMCSQHHAILPCFRPKAIKPVNHGLKLQKPWTKINFSSLSWFHQVFCHNHRQLKLVSLLKKHEDILLSSKSFSALAFKNPFLTIYLELTFTDKMKKWSRLFIPCKYAIQEAPLSRKLLNINKELIMEPSFPCVGASS